jgi:superfamily I DNA and/or RNA helicase
MAFTSYLIQKFDFRHENLFFKKVSDILRIRFEGKAGDHALIGNPNFNEHQVDAIFIASGRVIVIGFENFGGQVTYSENEPWLIQSHNGEISFLAGGNQTRNPSQRLKAHHRAVSEFLDDSRERFLDGTRIDIDWSKIIGAVLFNQGISSENSMIPPLIPPWLCVLDETSFAEFFIHLNSNSLLFSDIEIKKLLQLLGVNQSNVLETYALEQLDEKGGAKRGESLVMARRHLLGTRDDSLPVRILNYYRTMLALEKFRTPEAGNLHPHRFQPGANAFELDFLIDSVPAFQVEFLKNLGENFPKNVFVAFNIKAFNQVLPLFHTILLAGDLRGRDRIFLNFDQFEIYSKQLAQMGLPEDLIQETIEALQEVDTLQDKLKVFAEKFNVAVSIDNSISIGLSTESLVTAQLSSELGKMVNLGERLIERSLLKAFLQNSGLPANRFPLELAPKIRATEMNSSQQKAVDLAFKQPLTVVTGPPGTGKTQVVINLIANAIASGHSILFASKNNKAVDNVMSRLNALLHEPYLLRFGSRTEIETGAKLTLSTFIARSGQNSIGGSEDQFNKALKAAKSDADHIQKISTRIASLQSLRDEVSNLEDRIRDGSEAHDSWKDSLAKHENELFLDKGLQIRASKEDLALLMHQIDGWNRGGLSGLLFKWFKKKGFETKVKSLNGAEASEIRDYLSDNAPWIVPDKKLLDSAKQNLRLLFDLHTQGKIIIEKRAVFKKELDDLDTKFHLALAARNELEAQLPSLQAELRLFEERQVKIGLELLNQSVLGKLRKMNRNTAQRYVDFLPIQVWKDNDVQDLKNTTRSFLGDFHAISVTNLSIKNAFPLDDELFDLLVIDEASQCDTASALPMIFRSKRAVIIGDPLQLRHITSALNHESRFVSEALDLESLRLNYVQNSLFDYCSALANKSGLESVFLKDHYRCHPDIVSFVNHEFYEYRLGQSMSVCTHRDQFIFGNPGMNWIHVQGKAQRDKNVNAAEAQKCIELVADLVNRHATASIGIITPFRDQKILIQELMPVLLKDRVVVDTVHRFQGDEMDIILLSMVVTEDSPTSKSNFINKNEFLLNVAITRARSSLYILGNYKYCANLKNGAAKTPLSKLAHYVSDMGRVKDS